ncbi:hypothetical protein GCM10009795_007680 [Nocardioides hankookensis]|uniref:Htaa domain-containing protein n=1 Tax=Nocardioides hankookensis TaxID=443157 RepID=A0ABW1LIJ5_9ACTN
MRPDRLAAAALAAVVAVLLAVPALADDASPAASTSVEVDDATLRWGINNESNNRAHDPTSVNFMSAGKVADSGGQKVTAADWSAVSGSVRIEKWDGTAWQPATWAGLSTDSAGRALGSATAGTFSNHNVVFGGGVGAVDAAAGTAHIAWTGDLSVLYYSGQSMFYLSDPVLDVADGAGTVTATISGFAASRNGGTWSPVAPRTATVAELSSVDLADATGFVAQPAYAGVRASLPADAVPQVTSDATSGSFPQSWIDAMDDLGMAAFWYSSGSSTDRFKVPLALTVGYDASAPVVPPTPTAAPTKKPIDNVVKESPTPTPTVAATVTAPAAPVAAPPVVVAPPVVAPTPVAEALGAVPRPATEVALAAAPTAPTADAGTPSSLPWWIGSGCLLAAALVLLLPVGGSGPGTRSTQK